MEPALAAIRLKNFSDAAGLLEPLAKQGKAEAQYLLACLYRAGLGLTADPEKERSLLTAAATQNHANSAYSLALALLREQPRDPESSRHWLEIAARAGHPMAKRSLERGALPMEFLPATDLRDASARLSALWFAAESDDAALVKLLASPELVAARNEFGRDALMQAAESGASTALQTLLSEGADSKRADMFGTTALMLAASTDSGMAVTALLNAGADVEAQDLAGNTALMHAARTERVESVKLLLAAMAPGGKYNARNAEGWTALDWALRGESMDAVKVLRAAGLTATILRSEASTPSIPLRRATASDLYAGWSDLGVGATRASPEVVNALLSSTRSQPWTAAEIRAALEKAVTTGNVNTAERLLPVPGASGTNPKVTAAVDPRLLDWAIRHGDSKMVDLLLPAISPDTQWKDVENPVLTATRAHQMEILTKLLEAGFDVAGTDKLGRDALMVASRASQLDLVQVLLQHHANPGRLDGQGRSALWYAAQTGFITGVYLLADSENRDREDKLGITPLAVAASEGRTDVVSLLLTKGARTAGAGRNGMTPLLLACANGHSATVKQLLAAGASADATGSFGNTALIIAARHGHADVVKLLLAAGANRQLRNSDGHSASDIAAALNNREIEATLKSG